jgi:hypothetical protein
MLELSLQPHRRRLMTIQMGTVSRFATVSLPVQPTLRVRLACNTLAWVVAFAILTVAVLLADWPGSATAPGSALRQVVNETLGRDAADTPERVVHTSMTAGGDFMVEFVLREQGDARGNRVAALSDALAIVRGVYEAPAPRPLNVTLLGVWRPSPTAGTLPLLYASLPADRMVGLDWTQVQADDLASFGVVRWMPAGVCHAWHSCVEPLD